MALLYVVWATVARILYKNCIGSLSVLCAVTYERATVGVFMFNSSSASTIKVRSINKINHSRVLFWLKAQSFVARKLRTLMTILCTGFVRSIGTRRPVTSVAFVLYAQSRASSWNNLFNNNRTGLHSINNHAVTIVISLSAAPMFVCLWRISTSFTCRIVLKKVYVPYPWKCMRSMMSRLHFYCAVTTLLSPS